MPSVRADTIAEVAIFGAGVVMLLCGIAAALGAGNEIAELLYYTAAIAVVTLGLLEGAQAHARQPTLADGGRPLHSRLRRWLRQRLTR